MATTETERLGQFQTMASPAPSVYDPEYLEVELNEIWKAINKMAQSVWQLTAGDAVADRTVPGVTTKTDSYDVDELYDVGVRFSNIGATGPVNFQLPAATTDQEYEFACDVGQTIYIWPTATNNHLGYSNGYAMAISTQGDLVRIGCPTNGTWRVLRQIGTSLAYFSFIPDAAGLPLPGADGYPLPGAPA